MFLRCVSFLAAATLALTSQTVPEVLSTAKDRTGLAVTIFHNDVALVRDQRRLMVSPGHVQLAMTDLAASIRQSSAWLWLGKDLPKIAERSFEFDLLTPRKLFRQGLGREAELQLSSSEGAVPATLLSLPSYASDPLLVQMGDGITAVLPNQVHFRACPPGLRANPTLLHAMASPGGLQDVELTYLADNFRWKPHYVLSLQADGAHLDLQAWAVVKNTSGLDLPACTLQLIAGTPNQLPFDEARDSEPPWDRRPPSTPPPAPPPRRTWAPATQSAVVEVVASAPEFQEASFFEYVLYTLDQPVSLQNNQSKQLSLFQAKDIPVQSAVRVFFERTSDAAYSANGQLDSVLTLQRWFEQDESFFGSQKGILESNTDQDKPHFSTLLRMTNDEAHNLGRALPAGPFTCFYASPEGLQLKVAEDSLEPMPRGTSQEIFLPGMAGVTASKRLTGRAKRPWHTLFAPWSRQIRCELEAEVLIQNERTHPVQVEVRECFPIDWKISENTHPFVRRGDFPEVLDFLVELPPRSTRVLRYRVATPLLSLPKAS